MLDLPREHTHGHFHERYVGAMVDNSARDAAVTLLLPTRPSFRDNRTDSGATQRQSRMRAEPKTHITAIADDAERAMYRFTIPIRALIEAGTATGTVSIDPPHVPEFGPGSPLLVQGTIALPPTLASSAKENRCRLVRDVDDPLSLSSDDTTIDRLLSDAELVTVSTEPLAQTLRGRGHAANLLPTAIDPRDWPVQPQRAPREHLRIGWHARRWVHADEVALLAGVVQTLIDEADFVFLGHVPDALADPSGRIERQAPVPLSFFPALLAALDLDIVLIPLTQNKVNEGRSNVALLQAGMLGYAVIGTDIEPHRTLPITRLSNSHEAWIAAIRERIHAVDAVRQEGETLRQAVHAGFLIGPLADRHLALWTGASFVGARG